MRLPRLILVVLFLAGSLEAQPALRIEATCTCRITLTGHAFSNPQDYRPLLIPTVSEGSAQFDVKIPLSASCRLRCREEFGADGTSVSSQANAAKSVLRTRAEQVGKPFNWCGGWLNTSLDSKKGRLPWRIGITGGPISIGGIRTCAQVPPGLSKTCCCGSNALSSFSEFPALNWAINTNGHFDLIWWDREDHLETVKYPHFNDPLVSGSMHQDPFGDGVVALNEAGDIVRTIRTPSGQWRIEIVLPKLLRTMGGVRPCGLVSTVQPQFAGIWAITDEHIVRLYVENGAWKHDAVQIGDHGGRIAPSSLHEIGNGRIAGTLKNGQRWNVWFENGDQHLMRFDYSAGSNVAVSPTGRCSGG